MRRLLFLVAVVATLVACSGDPGTPKSKHALVIGVDGLLVEGLQQAFTPNLDELVADRAVTYDAFAGGVLGTPTEQATYSGPGWSSILTGVWVDKQGVTDNTFMGARYDEYPHFFARPRSLPGL